MGKESLRPVKFWTKTKDEIFAGWFHAWGQRSDENFTDFFAVIEVESGECIELDPCQIQFSDR